MPTEANALNASTTGIVGNTGTAFTGNALTQHDVLVGGASNAITSVSPSTSTYVLTSNGTGSDPSFQAVSASGAITTIDADSGSATPSSGVITVSGGSTGLTTSASSATVDITGTLKLSNGGTNANLTASNGGIFYSTSTAGAILSGTATADQVLLSGSSTTPAWSTTTYPSTATANEILYASSSNVIGQISTTDNGVLITGNTGVPSLLANSGTAGYVLTANTGAPPSWQAAASSGISTLDGDTGTASGSTVTIFTDGDCGESVSFDGNDASSLIFSVTDGNYNTTVGAGSGTASLGGGSSYCTAIGANTLSAIAADTYHVAVGVGALQTCVGQTENTAVGVNTLNGLTGGGSNTALGFEAGLAYESTETGNICIGAGTSGVTGESNTLHIGDTGGTIASTFIAGIAGVTVSNAAYVTIDTSTYEMGSLSPILIGLTNPNSGSNPVCTSLGYQAGASFGGSANNCTALGGFALQDATSGGSNTCVGSGAAQYLASGSNNTCIGSVAGSSYTGTESGNICLGDGVSGVNGESNALHIGDTGGTIASTFIAGIAGVTVSNAAYVTIDTSTNQMGSTPSSSPLIGFTNPNSGSNPVCTSLGYQAGASFGGLADNCTALGGFALQDATSGGSNTCVGSGAAQYLVSGSNNTCIGSVAGSSYTGTESGNICLGEGVSGVNGESNALHIGDTGGTITSTFIAGIDGVSVTGSAVLCSSSGQLGDVVSAAEYKDDIQDIDEETSILDMRPVKFHYKSDKAKTPCYGMLAEECDEVFPDLVLRKNGKPYSIKYHEMPALLLNEIKKLKKKIEALEAKVG